MHAQWVTSHCSISAVQLHRNDPQGLAEQGAASQHLFSVWSLSCNTAIKQSSNWAIESLSCDACWAEGGEGERRLTENFWEGRNRIKGVHLRQAEFSDPSLPWRSCKGQVVERCVAGWSGTETFCASGSAEIATGACTPQHLTQWPNFGRPDDEGDVE
jgi:hypothetical protein